MAQKGVEVKGTQQVEAAFNEVSHGLKDLSEAHRAEADMLLPDVERMTRRQTGALAAGWEPVGVADAAQFTNRISYAGVQEFGWAQHNIEPTLAVQKAFEANTEKTEKVYNDAIGKLARSANIETR
jgi:hypothetical protein